MMELVRRAWQKAKMPQSRILVVACVSLIVDCLMFDLCVPMLAVFESNLGLSELEIALLYSSYSIAALFFGPAVGYLSEVTRSPKLWLVLGSAALGGSSLLFAFAKTYVELILARIAQGLAGGALWTISLAFLADAFGKSGRLGSAMGTALAAAFVGSLIGPSIGGWLYELSGISIPFGLAAGLCIILAVLQAIWLRDIKKNEQNADSTWYFGDETSRDERFVEADVDNSASLMIQMENSGGKDESDQDERQEEIVLNVRDLIKSRRIWVLYFAAVVGAMTTGFEYEALPLYLSHVLNERPGIIGTVYTVAICGDIVAGPVAGYASDRFGRVIVVLCGLTATALLLPFVVITRHVVLFGAVFFFQEFALQVGMVPLLAMVSEVSEDIVKTKLRSQGLDKTDFRSMNGYVYGFFATNFFLGLAVSPIFTPLWDTAGFFWSFFACSCVLIVAGLLVLLDWAFYSWRRKKRTYESMPSGRGKDELEGGLKKSHKSIPSGRGKEEPEKALKKNYESMPSARGKESMPSARSKEGPEEGLKKSHKPNPSVRAKEGPEKGHVSKQ